MRGRGPLPGAAWTLPAMTGTERRTRRRGRFPERITLPRAMAAIVAVTTCSRWRRAGRAPRRARDLHRLRQGLVVGGPDRRDRRLRRHHAADHGRPASRDRRDDLRRRAGADGDVDRRGDPAGSPPPRLSAPRRSARRRHDVQPHVVVDGVWPQTLQDRVEERLVQLGRQAQQVRAERDGAQELARLRRALRRGVEPDALARRSPRAPGAAPSPRDRRSSTARASPRRSGRRARARRPRARRATIDATFPRPPHWATNGAPSFSAARMRAKSRSWSAIQWKVALETAASAGSSTVSSRRSCWTKRARSPPSWRCGLGDHRGRAVDPDDVTLRTQPLQQLGAHAAGAAAEVEHGLVAAQRQAVEDLGAPALVRGGDRVVAAGVPFARRVRGAHGRDCT